MKDDIPFLRIKYTDSHSDISVRLMIRNLLMKTVLQMIDGFSTHLENVYRDQQMDWSLVQSVPDIFKERGFSFYMKCTRTRKKNEYFL